MMSVKCLLWNDNFNDNVQCSNQRSATFDWEDWCTDDFFQGIPTDS